MGRLRGSGKIKKKPVGQRAISSYFAVQERPHAQDDMPRSDATATPVAPVPPLPPTDDAHAPSSRRRLRSAPAALLPPLPPTGHVQTSALATSSTQPQSDTQAPIPSRNRTARRRTLEKADDRQNSKRLRILSNRSSSSGSSVAASDVAGINEAVANVPMPMPETPETVGSGGMQSRTSSESDSSGVTWDGIQATPFTRQTRSVQDEEYANSVCESDEENDSDYERWGFDSHPTGGGDPGDDPDDEPPTQSRAAQHRQRFIMKYIGTLTQGKEAQLKLKDSIKNGHFWVRAPVPTVARLARDNIREQYCVPDIFFWDPQHAWEVDILCPYCKTKAHRKEWTEGRRVVRFMRDFWLVAQRYDCPNSQCKKTFNSDDAHVLETMDQCITCLLYTSDAADE